MRGGSQPDLVLTDNGWYVVKWQQNAQHRRVLINEVLGAELLKMLNIESPGWGLVHADEKFLAEPLRTPIQLGSHSVAIQTGWHFGSRVPVNPETTAIYDSLPALLMKRVANRHQYLRVSVFDRWVDNTDQRQSILYRPARNRALRGAMIDNGHAFGFDGRDWCMRNRAMISRDSSFSGLFSLAEADEQIDSAIRDIQSISLAALERIRRLLPQPWVKNDEAALTSLFSDLIKRARTLPEMVALGREQQLRSAKDAGRVPGNQPWSMHPVACVLPYANCQSLPGSFA
jgi:hypothetical protein